MSDTARKLKEFSTFIDASYPAGMDPELAMRRRVGKVSVEYAEMMDALEGYTAENPRKGVYATREDVVKELLDIAGAALGSVEHLTGNEGLALALFRERIDLVHSRAGLSS